MKTLQKIAGCIGHHAWILLLFCSITICPGQGQRLIDEIRNHEDGIGLWWIGHNTWIIKSGDVVLATDLLLAYDLRMRPPLVTAEELAGILDVSFITHGHNDHFNRAVTAALVEKSDCLFVFPESCISIADQLNIPAGRRVVAVPRESFEVMGLTVEPIRAIHGNKDFAIYYEANLMDCGYVIDVNGTRFLQPGDSYLLEDHLFLENIDVLFFSPTEHNMYIDRSVILINRLNPEYIFPQHHSTVQVREDTRFWAKGYPEEVYIRLSDALKKKYHIPAEGMKWEIK